MLTMTETTQVTRTMTYTTEISNIRIIKISNNNFAIRQDIDVIFFSIDEFKEIYTYINEV